MLIPDLAPDLAALPPWLFKTYIFVLGAMVGSFLNVVIARLPVEGESVIKPRSKCPHCGYMIPWYLNIPILSWFILRGKCGSCKAPISFRYPMVEALTAILFLAVADRFGPTLACLVGLILTGALVPITFIDIDIFEIPDEISLSGILIGIVLRPLAWDVPWWSGLLGAALGGGFLWIIAIGFEKLAKKEGMGFGDVKLIAMIGAFLGPYGILPTVMVGSVVGSVIGGLVLFFSKDVRDADLDVPFLPDESLFTRARQALTEKVEGWRLLDEWRPPPGAIPYGPFLALGAIAQLLFGPALQKLFFSLFPFGGA